MTGVLLFAAGVVTGALVMWFQWRRSEERWLRDEVTAMLERSRREHGNQPRAKLRRHVGG